MTLPGVATSTQTDALPVAPIEEVPATPADAATAPRTPRPHPVHHIVFPHLTETIRSFLSVIVVALFVLTFIVQPFRIPSESMERTLMVGDFLLVNKMAESRASRPWSWTLPYGDVHRGDVIVFHFPANPDEHLVKRVIGVPGDHIRLIDGVVYLNGKPQIEPYAIYRGSYPDSFRDQFPDGQYTDPAVDTQWWLAMRRNLQNGELIVPPGLYFVLGDNRNNSRDSRYWGFVPRENIVGRPLVIYWSVQDWDRNPPSSFSGRLYHLAYAVTHMVQITRWNRTLRLIH